MNIVGPKIDVKRLLGRNGLIDESDRILDKATGNFRSLHPRHRRTQSFCIFPNAFGFRPLRLHGKGQKLGPHPFEVCKATVEPVG